MSHKAYDSFSNNVFSDSQWSAPTCCGFDETKKTLDGFHLSGKKIKSIKAVGYNYIVTNDNLESYVYTRLAGLPETMRQKYSDMVNFAPSSEFLRAARIDEPLLIEFTDGNVFEICAYQIGEFRMSMNLIPWNTEAGVNVCNCDCNILFSDCLGETIAAIEIDATDSYTGKVIKEIRFRFESGGGLYISAWLDYCEVGSINIKSMPAYLTFSELKPGLYYLKDTSKGGECSNE